MITAAAGFTQGQWEAYHQGFRDFRNTYASHRQLVSSGNIPDMTPALEIAKAYFEWLMAQIPGSNRPKPLAEYLLQSQIETLQVLGRDLTAAL